MSNGKKQANRKSQTEKLARVRRRAKQRQRQQSQIIPLIIFGVIIIVVAFIIATAPTSTALPRNHPSADGNAMGDPKAPVVIENFSDFQCSHCRNFYQTTEAYIIENYIATGKVYFIFHSFGDTPGGDSGRAARAAYCAGDQNKFWEMHDTIYDNFSATDNGGYSLNRLTAMAKKIKLDMDAFESCLNSDKYIEKVDSDAILGIDKGVTGTPTFFINDQIIVGNQSQDYFIQVIEAELAKVEE